MIKEQLIIAQREKISYDESEIITDMIVGIEESIILLMDMIQDGTLKFMQSFP